MPRQPIEEYLEAKYEQVGEYLVNHADTFQERKLKYQMNQAKMRLDS
jgi:hypothetical protein